jgi:amidohydrolase
MDTKTILDQYRPALGPYEDAYRDIHRNPELSKQEVRTANIAAVHLEALKDFTVHRGIGGHGVVGVLRNGPGPTVLLRADMDALPHLENTGLEYASTKVAIGNDSKETPVMHACGHDMHVATLMAGATFLHSAKDRWSGALICLFQPNEETAGGAKAMVADGLWDQEKFGIPIPGVLVGQHVHAARAGCIALSGGHILTSVDAFEVRIYGKSGHISRADLCVDPIVTASHIVLRLQTVATKEVRPEDFVVVACPSIHGGNAANIIPDYVDMKMSIRTYKPEVRDRVMAAVKKIIYAECETSGSLVIREPTFTTLMQAPPTINDMEKSAVLKKAFKEYFGGDAIDWEPFGASEDFSILATSCGAPYVFYSYGCVEAEKWDEAEKTGTLEKIPHNHSAFFAPVVQPTMTRAIDAFALAALTFFNTLS